jgi:hypothetical protein
MKQGLGRPRPATLIAVLALMAALAGTAYAAGRIDGRKVRVGSLPGNRLKLHSVPANRLKPGLLAGGLVGPGQITGSQIDERSLGQVPSAAYADVAGTAQTAIDSQTAVNAVNAVDATTVNGHGAGCMPGTQPFAGACWQSSASEAAATAPAAAVACAALGGELPEALQLAAFAQHPGVQLDAGDEWSSDLTNYSGSKNAYGLLTVSSNADIEMALPTNTRHYRCVIPLVA